MSSATSSAKAPPSDSLSRKRMRFKHKFMLITFSLLLMALLRTGFIFFVIGMMPCVVAYYMDVSKNQYTFKSIFASNLSGMMPFVTRIIREGPSSALLQEIMGDASNWFIIYGAAFMGWLLIKICPLLAQAMVKGMHQTQIMRYDWLQKKLESEWGEEVKQFDNQKLDD